MKHRKSHVQWSLNGRSELEAAARFLASSLAWLRLMLVHDVPKRLVQSAAAIVVLNGALRICD